MKFIAFLLSTSLLTIFVSSLTVRASGSVPERGNRVVASVDARKAHVAVVEHLRDDGNLSLVIEAPGGEKLRADSLISALDRDEEDVSSYGVTAKALGDGGIHISSVKDWGTSTWSYGYTVAYGAHGYHLAKFDYKLESKTKSGTCSLDLANGAALVNGRKASFDAQAASLENVDGIDLERLCQRLGMK